MLRSVVMLGCAVLSLLFVRETTFLADGRLHFYFFDVGQGDAALVITPTGKHIVIDGGVDLALLEHLGSSMPFFDRTIELLLLSHPDADHIAALPELAKRYHIQRVLFNGTQHSSGAYGAFLHAIQEQGTQMLFADPRMAIDMGDGVQIEVVWPNISVLGTHPKAPNNASVVALLQYKNRKALFTGDIEDEAEQAILASGADIDAELLKVPHHGSSTSSSTGFLLSVMPDIAVISAGKENRYGHPHQEILDRYVDFGIDVHRTDIDGTLHIIWE